RLLARLERADLIEREPGAFDRRQTIVRLTTRGLLAVTSALRTFSNYRAGSFEVPRSRRRRRRNPGAYPSPPETTGCNRTAATGNSQKARRFLTSVAATCLAANGQGPMHEHDVIAGATVTLACR